MSVQYPEMREQLIALLRAPNERDGLDGGSFDDWFNDLDWLAPDDVSESIGVVLTDEREAKAVATFRERLNAVFDDLGEVGYAAYRSDPRWPGVQEAARDALVAIESPDAPTR
jgi:hypothetical protein